MKKVISHEELSEVVCEAVDLLCDAVASTLGPTGNNVLINHSEAAPFITNDGVTIAKNIESSDPRINSVLEIIKEASLKTDELVGDGTTTTLVLLKSIFHHGLEEIKKGKNATTLKRELKESLQKIIQLIDAKKVIPKEEDMKAIAEVSSNSSEIGFVVSEVFFKMKNKYAIQLDESFTDQTYYEIKRGYRIEMDDLSNMYFQKNKEIMLNDCSILVLKGYVASLEQISDIVNEVSRNQQNLVIFVEEMEDAIKQQLLVYYFMEKKNIFMIPLPEYASHRERIELDLSYLSDCVIRNVDYESVFYMDLGKVDTVLLHKNEVVVETSSHKTKELIGILQEELSEVKNEYEKEFLESRLSRLEHGIATIYVGGITKTEIKEKMMRYEDSLCALEIAKEGILPGGGITFLEISQNVQIQSTGDKILKKSLDAPFEKMLENIGNTKNEIQNTIIESNYQKIFNFKTLELEDVCDTKVLDPAQVLITALKNAVSIASLLLSINYLVINEKEQFEKNISL